MPPLGARKRMTDDEIQQAYAEARRRMRAGSAAASPSPGIQRRGVSREGDAVGSTVLDLGQRKNTTQGARAGQQFRDYVSGGREYHQYAGGPTVAVKARPADQLRQAVSARAQQAPQGGDVQDRLTQLAQAYANRGATSGRQEQAQGIMRRLFDQRRRRRTV